MNPRGAARPAGARSVHHPLRAKGAGRARRDSDAFRKRAAQDGRAGVACHRLALYRRSYAVAGCADLRLDRWTFSRPIWAAVGSLQNP